MSLVGTLRPRCAGSGISLLDGGSENDALVSRAWLGVITAPPGGYSPLTLSTRSQLLSGAKDITVYSLSGRGEGVECVCVCGGVGWGWGCRGEQSLPTREICLPFGFENPTGERSLACFFRLSDDTLTTWPPGGAEAGIKSPL